MLSSISWQHYLAAIIILTVSYYLYVVLRYYQADIANLFNRKPKSTNIFSGIRTEPAQVMGATKLDSGAAISDSHELQFSESLPDEIENLDVAASEPSKELVIEAGNLIEAFKDIDDKPEFLNLLKILIGSYKRFQDEIDIAFAFDRIRELAKEKLKFPVALSDLQTTWA